MYTLCSRFLLWRVSGENARLTDIVLQSYTTKTWPDHLVTKHPYAEVRPAYVAAWDKDKRICLKPLHARNLTKGP